MKKNNFIRSMLLLSLFLIVGFVMVGHYIGRADITSFGEEKVTMKFVTAVLFLLSTISLLFKRQFISVIIIITSIYTYSSWAFNHAKPLFLPVFESDHIVRSLEGDIPSWATLFSFIVFAVSGISGECKILINTIAVVALIAFIGHLIEVPFMYYYFDGYSTGMAINTSMLFMHLAAYRMLDKSK